MKRRVALVLMATVLMQTGCQRLKFNEKYTLDANHVKELMLDPPAYEQRLKVTVKPTNVGVAAYVVKSSDARAVENACQASKEPNPALYLGKGGDQKAAASQFTFECTVPAKTEYSVILWNGPGKNEVTVDLVGK